MEISRSNTIYGSYSIIATIDATSDGNAKSSSNTWVTTYTDTTGTRTHWYKIRFYDSATTLWSAYSDPISAEDQLQLCTVDDIKRIIDTVGRWSDDEIFDMIVDVDDLIYMEMGTPLQQTYSDIGRIDNTVQTRYYVGEENIYRVDRVFYGTTTKVELYLNDGYQQNLKYGMVEILPVGSSGITPNVDCEIEIRYVPKIYNKLSKYRVAKRLLEMVDTTSGGKMSKELEVVNRKLDDVEQLVRNRIAPQLSSDVKYYDSLYGVNRRKIIQDFDRNKYVGSVGWTDS